MRLVAVVAAAFSSGLLGVVFRRPLGERRGLTLGRPQGFLKLGGKLAYLNRQLIDLSFQLSNPAVLMGRGIKELLVGRLGHPGHSRRRVQLRWAAAGDRKIIGQWGRRTVGND